MGWYRERCGVLNVCCGLGCAGNDDHIVSPWELVCVGVAVCINCKLFSRYCGLAVQEAKILHDAA